MVKRRFWLNLIEQAWREKPVVWLAGVRRVGKTCLCQSLPDVEYFDCELPRVRRMMEDPQGLLDACEAGESSWTRCTAWATRRNS